MSRITSTPLGEGRTHVLHEASGATIETRVSPEFDGGAATAFSSTDLVAAALGSCISSSLERIADRSGIPYDAISIVVDKQVGTNPRRITRLDVTISIAYNGDERLARVIDRAAHTCVVHRSLHPEIDAPVIVVFTP